MRKVISRILLATSVCVFAIPAMAADLTDINKGWVRLYDDKGFKDRVLTVKYPKDVVNMNDVKSDNGKKGFGDKTSSVKWQIPKGWKVVLFDDHDYKDSTYELVGTGTVKEVSDLGSFSDKCSSLRWEKTTD